MKNALEALLFKVTMKFPVIDSSQKKIPRFSGGFFKMDIKIISLLRSQHPLHSQS